MEKTFHTFLVDHSADLD
jgi:vacuolar protein sorting-associated protein 18